VKLEKRTRIIWKFSCEASVDGELVTVADMLCAATEKE
jgi:3-hydroxymyristoyl/3-hydroxydecanoyl-(acyl carrier protein) dehydratase